MSYKCSNIIGKVAKIYLIKFGEVDEYGDIYHKDCFKNNTMDYKEFHDMLGIDLDFAKAEVNLVSRVATIPLATLRYGKSNTIREWMKNRVKPFVPLEKHEGYICKDLDNDLLDAQRYSIGLLANMYKVPKGILNLDGTFEFNTSYSPGYPEDMQFERDRYKMYYEPAWMQKFGRGERTYPVFGLDNASKDEFSSSISYRLKHGKWKVDGMESDGKVRFDEAVKEPEWFKIVLKQKTTNMNKGKVIPLNDVILTDDERQQVSDQLKKDKEAMNVADHLLGYVSGMKHEDKKRAVKFFILAIDAEYETEKSKVAEQIKNLEDVLLEKNSKITLAAEFLK